MQPAAGLGGAAFAASAAGFAGWPDAPPVRRRGASEPPGFCSSAISSPVEEPYIYHLLRTSVKSAQQRCKTLEIDESPLCLRGAPVRFHTGPRPRKRLLDLPTCTTSSSWAEARPASAPPPSSDAAAAACWSAMTASIATTLRGRSTVSSPATASTPPSCGASAANSLERYDVEYRPARVTDARPRGRRISKCPRRPATACLPQTPARHRRASTHIPDVEGCATFFGCGVFHCPYCDGWEVRDRRLAAYGNGKSVAGPRALPAHLERRRGAVHRRRGRIPPPMPPAWRPGDHAVRRRIARAGRLRVRPRTDRVPTAARTCPRRALFLSTGEPSAATSPPAWDAASPKGRGSDRKTGRHQRTRPVRGGRRLQRCTTRDRGRGRGRQGRHRHQSRPPAAERHE